MGQTCPSQPSASSSRCLIASFRHLIFSRFQLTASEWRNEEKTQIYCHLFALFMRIMLNTY